MSSTRKSDNSSVAWRQRVYPIAIIATIVLSVVLGALRAADSAAPGDAIGGDYPAFYGAGLIAADGDLEQLHNPARQAEAQAGLHPAEEGEVSVFFPYPPQIAVVYQPLASMDYHWSYLAHTFLMGTALWAAIWLVQPMIPWIRGRVLLAATAAILFWPMFRTITGGSNTALTLLLLTAGWRLIHEDRQLLAGLVLAGLFFKPQFAIPFLGLLLLARYWGVIAGATIGGIAFYLWGVALLGWNWAVEWATMARDFGALEAEINGHSSISFIGFTQNIFGVGVKPIVVAAWACAIGLAFLLSWLWWKSDSDHLTALVAITIPGVLLLAPHVMTHDGSLIVLTSAILVASRPSTWWIKWVAAIWLLGASQLFIRQLGFSPGFPMLLIVLASAWALLAKPDQATLAGHKLVEA